MAWCGRQQRLCQRTRDVDAAAAYSHNLMVQAQYKLLSMAIECVTTTIKNGATQ